MKRRLAYLCVRDMPPVVWTSWMCVSSYQSQKSRGLKLQGFSGVDRTVMTPGLDGTVPGVLLSGASDIVDAPIEPNSFRSTAWAWNISGFGRYLRSFSFEQGY